MRLKWGPDFFDVNSTMVATRIQTILNNAGIPLSQRKMFDVTGYLVGDGQAALTIAENNLKTALSRHYQDLVLYQDSGIASSEILINQGSITGVRITKGPDFVTNHGPEYATLRSFSFTAEAEYPVLNTDNLLMSYQEVLSFTGGGPLTLHRLAVNGPPQKQLVYPSTVFKVSQRGKAEGYRHYPSPNAPKWPDAEQQHLRNVEIVSPDRVGLTGYQRWGVTWQYQFESANPLIGVPSLWV